MDVIKVLIVEDEILVGYHLQSDLKRAGYDVCCLVSTGEEAVAAAKKEQPDVIVMDIRLIGVMDGIEAARQISTISNARIIFATGYQDSSIKERVMALNPAAYLIKPVDGKEIDRIIQSIRIIGKDGV